MTMTAQLIAVDPAALDEIKAELAALRRDLQRVQMQPRPQWVTVKEYALQAGRTPRTVQGWIKAGKIESRREGGRLMVKVVPT